MPAATLTIYKPRSRKQLPPSRTASVTAIDRMPVHTEVYRASSGRWAWRLCSSRSGPAFARGTADDQPSAWEAAREAVAAYRRAVLVADVRSAFTRN